MKTTGTLSDIARRCSVSQSTVSRVLNNSKKGRFSVSDEVRDRVLRAAKEMNYRPSVAARNLTASKTKLVAVLGVQGIWLDRVGPAEEAVGAASYVLDEAGYEMCLQFWSQRHGHFDPPPLRVDGVIAVGARSLEELQPLENAGIPYVSVNGVVGPNGSSINPDERGGTESALRHLAELGHQKVAYLDHASVDANHPSVFERRDAFEAVIAELGLEAPDAGLPLLGRDQPWDSYYEPFLRRTILQRGATAVIAYSHHAAMSLLRTAHELGLSVPRDFSLICFNNAPVLRLCVPSITAIDVPGAEMGHRAAEILLERMQGTGETQTDKQLRWPEMLIKRESTAPPSPRAQH